MNRFILKIIGFSAFIVFTILLAFFLNKKFADFKIENDKSILIVGHSLPECAFNDSLIHKVNNFAQSADSYFYTYFKVKKILEQNPQIDKLLIDFSNNQIDKDMEKWIWGDEIIEHKLPIYAPIMDLESYRLLLEKNSQCFYQTIPLLIRSNFQMLFKQFNYINAVGGYYNLKLNKTDSLTAVFNLYNDMLSHDYTQLSSKNLNYLQKIISLSQQHDVDVFLIRSPVHKKYPYNQNEKEFQNTLVSQFSTIEFLDFSKFQLVNEDFADQEHLNYKGSKAFSAWFSVLIDKGLFDKENKQQFIDDEIKSRTHRWEF